MLFKVCEFTVCGVNTIYCLIGRIAFWRHSAQDLHFAQMLSHSAAIRPLLEKYVSINDDGKYAARRIISRWTPIS